MKALVVSPNEAASLLKLNHGEVTRLLREGEVPAYRGGRNWKIPISTLTAYVEGKAIAEAKERKRLHEEAMQEGRSK